MTFDDKVGCNLRQKRNKMMQERVKSSLMQKSVSSDTNKEGAVDVAVQISEVTVLDFEEEIKQKKKL